MKSLFDCDANNTLNFACASCRIKTENINNIVSSSLLYYKDGSDVLILLDMADYDDTIKKFITFLNNKDIHNIQIYSATLCRTKNLEIPSPIYSVYNHCNCFDINKVKNTDYKVIIAVGKAIFYFLQGDDFTDWRDFAEFKFNPTFFYYKGKRVYPIPTLHEWIGGNGYQYAFTLQQFNHIKNYLKTYNNGRIEYCSNYEKHNIMEIKSKSECDEFFRHFTPYDGYMSLDIETNSLDIYKKDFKIGCISIAFSGNAGYYIPFEFVNKRLFSIFLQNKKIITANGKFDAKAIYNVTGIKIKISEDIVLLAHVLNTFRTKNGLKTLAWFVNHGGYDNELHFFMKKHKIQSFLDLPKNLLITYSVLDAIVTYKVFMFLYNHLVPKQKELYELYLNILIPTVNMFVDIEHRGMLLDVQYINQLQNQIKLQLKEKEKIIFNYFGQKFDLNSPKQLGEILEKKNFTCLGKSKLGYYKTGIEQLEIWKKENSEIISNIIEYRELSKLFTSFVGTDENSGLLQYKDDNNCVHANFGIAMTSSLRSNCSDPNLQQIPKNEEIRKMFTAPNDYVFMECDYSGFQLRIAGIYAQDNTMIDIFKNKNGDIHSITAQQVFAKDITIEEFLKKKKEKPYSEYRFKAKGINFGFLFGLSAEGFKPVIEKEWTEQEIDEFIEKNNLQVIKNYNNEYDKCLTIAFYIREQFFKTYSKLLYWINNNKRIAEQQGYIDCIIGGRRHLPLLCFNRYANKSNNKEKNHLENIAINSPVQSFEAIMLYRAIINIYNELQKNHLKSYIVAMVHDSLVLYVHKDEIDIVKTIVKQNAEDYTTFSIPIIIEIQVGTVWGFGQEII